ncbi:MAG: dipeptide epimerase [Rhizobiales bacterium]|nr:dipeptide epimerase [Hyphomicrobiales bacterium]
MPDLETSIESWPIDGEFVISRGAKREAVVVVARVTGDGAVGVGECVPYARYGETPQGVVTALNAMAPVVAAGTTRAELLHRMPAGAARNALDCALIDHEAHVAGRPAHEILGLASAPRPVLSVYTISLGTPADMARRASEAQRYPILKLKLGGEGDIERMQAVRRAVPNARIVADANEAWRASDLQPNLTAAHDLGLELIEQPLPAGEDQALADIEHKVPICADESFHTIADVAVLAGRYDAINIKLDKTGGLTAALGIASEARAHGMKVMVGCMLATSLAMAPALLLAQEADWVDLDGPLLLARDRVPGLVYEGALVRPAPPGLWGLPA